MRDTARAAARRILPGRVRRALRSAALPSVDVVVVVEPADLPRVGEALRSVAAQEDAAPGVLRAPVDGTWQQAVNAAVATSTADLVLLLRGCDVLAPDAVRLAAERLGRSGPPAGLGRLEQAGEPDPWLHRLQRAPEALEPRLAGTAIRRGTWTALSEHDDWLCSPTLAGLFAEHGPPLRWDRAAVTWYPDHGTRAYGATPSPLPGLEGLVERWARVEGRLGEDAWLTERWRRTVVGFELPRLLQDAERADVEQWAELRALAAQATADPGWTDGVGAAARALVALAAADRRESLEAVAAELLGLGDDLRTERRDSDVLAVWPVDALPDEVRRLDDTETAAVVHVVRTVAGGTDLWLGVGGVDLGDPETTVEVRERGGAPLGVTVAAAGEADRWWDRRFQSAVVVHVDAIGPAALTLFVRVGELERTVDVDLPAPSGPLASPLTVGGLDVEDDDLVLTVRGAVDDLRVLRRDLPVEVPQRTDGDRLRITLESDVLRRATALPPGSYRIVVGDANVAVADGLRARLPVEHRTGRHRLRAHLGPRGGLVLELGAPLADDEAGRRAQERLQTAYRRDGRPLDPGLVYFESYAGRTATDSPLAIFEELRARRPDLRLVWGISDAGQSAPDGAESVLLRSREWYAVLPRARALVLNTDTEAWFRRRPGQYLLQTFHGYPSKAMGASQWEAQEYSPARVRELRARGVDTWSTILTPTPDMTHHYREQYAYRGPALDRGYPRDDALVAPAAAERRAAARRLLGIRDDQTAVLYAPTWREHLAFRPRGAAMTEHLDLAAAAAALGDRFVLLLRGHRFHAPVPVDAPGARIVDVTAYPEVNDLILAADASVLDYSSMRFDIALTGRPMVFLVPDLDDYASGSRRFLFPFEESAPGPLVVDTAGVVEQLLDPALAERWAGPIAEFNVRWNPFQDGRAAARVVDALEQVLDAGPAGASR
ncbi:CDP-glycerol glycerophosphotransferase family protein [Nocardioides sp. YIM 152315]|uniref:CDP-glycerol glycerophosphotransferase family protein n=1 Tax=Nocardioides sp. YIM 152315 TaxID=3031760 RepID=UPI0023DA6344|nr:CDP-glycerol glycerophosphotransferase family protein [Nocardioides sp. YIM 152315]MDF1606191.1 CDP-glycerol glycerophosphotransferase family protein [Nocardioides sp. YIM 152315]